jgi:urea carboxylase-associated protein 2
MDQLWSTTLNPGAKWSGRVGKGKTIRFTANEAGANVSLLVFNALDLTERYNMPDTLKAQYTAHLTTGNILMSDNGLAMASFIRDDLGWHDTISGYTSRLTTDEKYGKTTYQQLRNDWLRSGEENLTVELVRIGLGVRDLGPVVNLFSKVYCDDEGTMRFSPNHCKAGSKLTLRTEMDVVLVLSNTPNPLDPSLNYPSVPVTIEIGTAEPVDEATDVCVNHRSENRRAFENTWNYNSITNR